MTAFHGECSAQIVGLPTLSQAYSDNLEDTGTNGSGTLSPRTTGPYTVRYITDSTVNINKGWVEIPVSLDEVTKVPRVSSDAKPIPGLHNNMGQLESGRQRKGRQCGFPPTDVREPESARCATDEIVGQRSTKDYMEYEVRWYEYT